MELQARHREIQGELVKARAALLHTQSREVWWRWFLDTMYWVYKCPSRRTAHYFKVYRRISQKRRLAKWHYIQCILRAEELLRRPHSEHVLDVMYHLRTLIREHR